MNDDLSFSGQESGWQDYSGADWDLRKPVSWLHDWEFWQYCAHFMPTENPILELACGNGRITRQLIEEDFSVVAVDINPHFLSRAQANIPDAKLNQVDFYLQDVVHLNLERQFDIVIMADWAFPALLKQDDQQQFFHNLANHLHENGIFAFNTTWSATRQLGLYIDQQGVWRWDENPRTFDPLSQVETDARGPHAIKFRHNTYQELKLLAKLAGFKILEQYGNVDRRPLAGRSGDDLTLILQKD